MTKIRVRKGGMHCTLPVVSEVIAKEIEVLYKRSYKYVQIEKTKTGFVIKYGYRK